jgi:ATPase subunit of ABC transporter with duplicated ATPase domains
VKAKVALKLFIEEAKRSKNAQTANQAASRQKALEKMEDLEEPKYEKPWSFTFPDPGKPFTMMRMH